MQGKFILYPLEIRNGLFGALLSVPIGMFMIYVIKLGTLGKYRIGLG